MEALRSCFRRLTPARVRRMCLGVLLIGAAVACYRLSLFGVDAFTCMNLGVSGFVHVGFGTWQLLVNLCILVFVFFLGRENIGLGTVMNMVFVGYIADFLCWLALEKLGLHAALPGRIAFLAAGSLLAALGCALYMAAELGVSPYDSVAILLEKLTKGKLTFRAARVLSDVTCVAVGVVFCLLAKNELQEIVGLGTILNALFNGPLIQFFKGLLDRKPLQDTA